MSLTRYAKKKKEAKENGALVESLTVEYKQNRQVFSSEIIRPYYKSAASTTKITRKTRKSAVLTDKPEKNTLALQQSKKKENKSKKRKSVEARKSIGNKTQQENTNERKKTSNKKSLVLKRKVSNDSDEESEIEDDYFCLMCVIHLIRRHLVRNGILLSVCSTIKLRKSKHQRTWCLLGVGNLFAWKDFTSKQKLKCRGDVVNSILYLTDVVKVTAKRGDTSLLYSTKYEESSSKVLNFLQPNALRTFPCLKRLAKYEDSIKQRKKNYVVEKLCPFMPSNRRGFWLSIQESEVPDLVNADS
ncbi:hypothetical protein WA026_023457 [Henosepilachna vigintioctopunctata]|uniref:Uncharacterized protein n=1 Tax=Henosepilachna vigintioctopunctata TaxID=420089 RepID=A0AAW1VHU9_9CUCU